ncbi:Ribonuclease H-like superfamily [Arabidopsis thaliana x Arabidopsis arenosa]|uniref:Ribonuclease H-like superfamily n=1 Tax=Arabidopsis thaliana x Arabidopsis arenosa TaxID=1240361 RepID=A0A8T1YAD0_9BRAS|nr:Ribonuclease H-like superfamily [Arabidopsis thaliana x Arabidopsis arenosa]
MREIHEGAGGNHSGGRALALRIRKHGHYWPTMISDCKKFVARCEKCQRHAPIVHAPTELLQTATPPYPFMRWTMDIVGPFPASRQKKYLLIMMDYFTKWAEVESYARIQSKFKGFCANWRIRLRKPTPRYPQGNGQAKATNKTIIDGLKNQTPFSLAYGLEAMAPSEVGLSTIRRSMLVQDPSLNDKILFDNLDTIEEQRDQALLCIQNYQ